MRKDRMKKYKIYKLLLKYVLENSVAKDFITNYMETQLKYIAKRLQEDSYDIVKTKRK